LRPPRGQPANHVYYFIRAEFMQPVTIREENCPGRKLPVKKTAPLFAPHAAN
jgi:hypothetical protein